LPVTLTSIAGGLVGIPAIVAFGDNVQLITVLGETIDLTGLNDMTFIVPRDGTITNLDVFFSVTAGITLVGSTVNVHATLYSADPASNTLAEVAGSTVTLAPGLTGIIPIGTAAYGTSGPIAIAVTEGTRLALVLSITVTGVEIATSIIGTVSAGLAIS
jgi:BclB C-terminal domain-containing protein